MTQHYVCIHGHFYQPPRENPWLEAIELQDSAYPFHDWNERITDECYRPNTRSRMLNADGWIQQIVNNFSNISFNFGPTVLSWLEEHAPDVYERILEADRESMRRFSGHGSALAQAYNHMILPLADERDRETQITWGIRDFEKRFHRSPEGMWLPETAVDTATLEALAANDIQFTILAPRQAGRVRSAGAKRWKNLDGDVDPSRAYLANLPSGKSIALFFYDGPISQAVAFEGLLNSGRTFADRLLSGFDDQHRDWPQLLHIATDGESYGHHHRHGDMALAAAIDIISNAPDIQLTNYGEFLEKHPPETEVEILEDTSWSCIHGIGRWQTDCGCHTGGHSDWHQQWRAPLRHALDTLRDQLKPRYDARAAEVLADPWSARDEYIDVIQDRSTASLESYFARHANRTLSTDEQGQLLKLLEMQRHAMLMYTSCGWFFDELSGIETTQVLVYAGRAIQLAEELFQENFEDGFLSLLEQAPSNLPHLGNGRRIYEEFVKPCFVDLQKAGAHFALSSLFEEYQPQMDLYCYDVALEDSRRKTTGKARLHVGRVTVTSRITRDSERLAFAVVYLGEHIMNGAVHPVSDGTEFEQQLNAVVEAFERADFAALFQMLETDFGGASYSLATLFRDEQRRVVNMILESQLEDAEMRYRMLYESHAPFIRFLANLNIPAPRALLIPAELVLDAQLRDALQAELPDPAVFRALLAESRSQSVALDEVSLQFEAEAAIDRAAERLCEEPQNTDLMKHLIEFITALRELPFEVDMATLQNAYWSNMQRFRSGARDNAAAGDESAAQWLEVFDNLGTTLHVKVDQS